jgi:hypothetical protein
MQLQLANSVALTRHSVAILKAPPRYPSFLDYVRSGPPGEAVSGLPIGRFGRRQVEAEFALRIESGGPIVVPRMSVIGATSAFSLAAAKLGCPPLSVTPWPHGRVGNGAEDAFPRPKPSGRCRFGQATFAGTQLNGRDAPIAVLGAILVGLPHLTPSGRSLNQERRRVMPHTGPSTRSLKDAPTPCGVEAQLAARPSSVMAHCPVWRG